MSQTCTVMVLPAWLMLYRVLWCREWYLLCWVTQAGSSQLVSSSLTGKYHREGQGGLWRLKTYVWWESLSCIPRLPCTGCTWPPPTGWGDIHCVFVCRQNICNDNNTIVFTVIVRRLESITRKSSTCVTCSCPPCPAWSRGWCWGWRRSSRCCPPSSARCSGPARSASGCPWCPRRPGNSAPSETCLEIYQLNKRRGREKLCFVSFRHCLLFISFLQIFCQTLSG